MTFEELAKIIEDFLKENGHPHITIIADSTHVEMLEGVKATPITGYIED